MVVGKVNGKDKLPKSGLYIRWDQLKPALASVVHIPWGIFYAFINASNIIPANGH